MKTNEFREFCRARPDKQNILDVFKGKWICEVPVESGLSTGGKVNAFEDARIEWLLDAQNWKVLLPHRGFIRGAE